MNTVHRLKRFLDQHPFWMSAFFASIGSVLILQHLHRYKNDLGLGMSLKNIVVAKRTLLPGMVFQEADFYIQAVPEKNVPLASLYESDIAKVLGKKVTRPISQDELIQWAAVNPATTAAGYLSSTIPSGYRAISVQVSSETSLGNQIQTSDHVDVLIQIPKKPGEPQATITLLQNVNVLDIGEASKDDTSKGYAIITLLVLPKEASLISHAKQFGALQFILRNPEDFDADPSVQVLEQRVFTQQAFRESIQKNHNRTIEIIRRGKSSTQHEIY